MAILDDNNSGVAAGFGRDPLAELDAELERLRIELGESPEEKHAEIKRPGIVKRITALMLAIICAALLLCACGEDKTDVSPTEPTQLPTVIVNDSELGTISLLPPEDASVNTYSTANLTLDDNGYYTYTVDGVKVSEMGVDLSENQEGIDFDAMKESGIDFVMLRIGGRGYGSGKLYADSAFDTFYQQAKDAGLKIGAYFFSQAIDRDEAAEEAQYALSLLDGRELDYPIAFDWEYFDEDEARTDHISGPQVTLMAAAFCDTVEEGGYSSIVYANTSMILQEYDFDVMKGYDFWLADYRELPEQDAMYYHFSMWQYTDSGVIPGYEYPVDLNLCLQANHH